MSAQIISTDREPYTQNQIRNQPSFGIPSIRGFKIAALNIASLYKHIDQLRIYMSAKSVDILAINETRLDCTISNGQINIPGYVIERKERNRSGGGVALYIRTQLIINASKHQEDDLEFLCIQVSKPKIKPFLVGTWYRPPGSTIETIARFESTPRERESYNLEVNIIGDVNCDIGASPEDNKT